MIWVLCSIVIFIGATIVFFQIPYSKTKDSFHRDIQLYINRFALQSSVFTEQDIELFPKPVQNHFRKAGYIGKPKMKNMKAYMQSVPLKESNDKSPMIVDYTLYSFAQEPVRLAYIRTSIFGIPFEGYDSTKNGVGFMKGVIGKIFTLFNETGSEMDKGQLITYLSECFLIPSSIFGEYITWEAIDSNHVKASITYGKIMGSGIFTFSDNGFVESFYTEERARIGTSGSIDYPGWSVVYDDYREENGIYIPNSVKVIWHEGDNDLIYFDASDIKISYGM